MINPVSYMVKKISLPPEVRVEETLSLFYSE